MAVAVTLRQRERFLKPPKRPKGLTPLEATASGYGGQSSAKQDDASNVTPPEYSDPIHDPADLAPFARGMSGCNKNCPPNCRVHNLRYRREWLYAQTLQSRFWYWLRDLALDHHIPLDNCLTCIDNLTLYVEAFLVAAVTYPDLAEREWADIFQPAPDDDAAPVAAYWTPRTEAEAAGMGLTVKPRRRRKRPTLPGCHGAAPDGTPCLALRHFGHKYCPSHEKQAKEANAAAGR